MMVCLAQFRVCGLFDCLSLFDCVCCLLFGYVVWPVGCIVVCDFVPDRHHTGTFAFVYYVFLHQSLRSDDGMCVF